MWNLFGHLLSPPCAVLWENLFYLSNIMVYREFSPNRESFTINFCYQEGASLAQEGASLAQERGTWPAANGSVWSNKSTRKLTKV